MRLQTPAVPIAFSPFLPIMQMCLGNDSRSGKRSAQWVYSKATPALEQATVRPPGNVAGALLGTETLLPAVPALTLVISVVGRLILEPRIPSTTRCLALMSTSGQSNEGGHSVVSVDERSGGKSDPGKREPCDPESRCQHLRTLESRPSFSRYIQPFPKAFHNTSLSYAPVRNLTWNMLESGTNIFPPGMIAFPKPSLP